jgi:hypothetical protein
VFYFHIWDKLIRLVSWNTLRWQNPANQVWLLICGGHFNLLRFWDSFLFQMLPVLWKVINKKNLTIFISNVVHYSVSSFYLILYFLAVLRSGIILLRLRHEKLCGSLQHRFRNCSLIFTQFPMLPANLHEWETRQRPLGWCLDILKLFKMQYTNPCELVPSSVVERVF